MFLNRIKGRRSGYNNKAKNPQSKKPEQAAAPKIKIRTMKIKNEKILDFVKYFPYISCLDLGELLEWLEGNGFLTKGGKKFREEFAQVFLKRYWEKNK